MKHPHRPSLAAALCALALPTLPTLAADDAALQRCRALAEPAARLACYDALPLRGVAVPAPAAAPAATPPAAPAVPAAATVPAAAAAPTAAAQDFGKERRDEPPALNSHIEGRFEGWGPGSRIKLANGQVWQVIDGSEGLYVLQSPKVTVRRALLGGFQLDITGANRMPRVRRVE